MTTRLDNWPAKLNALIESRRMVPFAWGENDCCLFAADAVQAMTGTDLAADLRGTYKTALGAARVLKKHGGVSGVVTAKCPHEQPLQFSQRGDVVLAHIKGEETLGVCVGASVAFVGPHSLLFWPLMECSRSWRVGRTA